jgi:hypothetical protein
MRQSSVIPGAWIRGLRFRALQIGILAWVAMTASTISQDAAHSGTALPPTITFTLDFPQSSPEHYSVSVDATGHARYECSAKEVKDSDDEETYRAEFDISTQNRERIFDWAKQAHYFAGKVDSGNSKLAFTGAKVLSYQENDRSFTARYNYSHLEPVRELTAFFQSMAGTLEYGRRLAYYHRYQKLALDEELKRMQAQAKNNELSEIQGVTPVLREIVEDASVMNVVRARAQELIQMSESGR